MQLNINAIHIDVGQMAFKVLTDSLDIDHRLLIWINKLTKYLLSIEINDVSKKFKTNYANGTII